MAKRYISDLRDGDLVEETFYVVDRQLRANRNAALYLTIDLRDRTGVLNARLWNVTEAFCEGIQPGSFVRVRGKMQVYQGSLQMILSHINPISPEGLDPADFEQSPSQNVEELLDELRQVFDGFSQPPLRYLMQCFLADDNIVRALGQMPAGVKAHHAYRGGLLEHIVTLCRLASKVCEVYPTLDREMLLTGVFLHDIGKLRELSCESGFVYTDEGQLIGHLVIGVEMLNEKIPEAEECLGYAFPPDLVLELKHLILSHHGTYEFGSPRLPMTPVAIALHLIDNLDAKLYEFHEAIQSDPNSGSRWTLFQPRLDRKLFKGSRAEARLASATEWM